MSYVQRTADWVITRAFVHAQRKGTPPSVGSDKYTVLLAIADSMQKLWRDEPDVEWDSLYQTINNGTITATDTFDLSDDVDFVSKRPGDYVLAVSSDGTKKTSYQLVRPNQLYQYRYDNAVAQEGRTLKFSKPFLSTDTQIGYTLNIPAYTYPDELTSGSSLVSVDNPMWLVYMTAAEFNRNDVVRVGQYNNLLTLANSCMEKMKANNTGQNEVVDLEPFVYGATWN